MIIPSIDLMNGHAVQLVGGRELAIDAGDPRPIAERFAVVGPLAVIDLDAALGQGSNRAVIAELCKRHRCRVGGGIRTVEAALAWLDAGAEQVILGTAAERAILEQLPRERVLVALDAVEGEVVVHGWRTRTGRSIEERMAELRDLCAGFLVTFVEREGRLGGTAMEKVAPLRDAAGPAKLTIAGGVTTAEEVAALDRLGVDAQVGMALYSGRLGLGESVAAVLTSDRPDGLFPTVVSDTYGRTLGLAWSSAATLAEAVDRRLGIYHSRKRGRWLKGETSGATQALVRVDVDCDRDAVQFVVEQAEPGFCHVGTWSCFGEVGGLPTLARRLAARAADAPAGSYTRRLLDDPALLAAKLREEVEELIAARDAGEIAHEAADVLYFTLVALAKAGVPLSAVETVLDTRARRVQRRPDKKPKEKPAFTTLRRVAPADVEAASGGVDEKTRSEAARIVGDVEKGGEAAVRRWAEHLGDLAPGAPLLVERPALEAAAVSLNPSDLAVLQRTAARIRHFAGAQRASLQPLNLPIPGGAAGHDLVPIERVGCYAPGGRFPLPSSVLMTVIPARVAGARQVIVASPRPTPVTLAAAWVAGADAVLAVGGAQAIAALTFGAGVPAVDFLAGPGNRWVTAAKQQVAGRVGIDMLAGPSELLVLADDSAQPDEIAADLLAQAEHDPDARPVLVTPSAALIEAVEAALHRQLADLPTAAVAAESLARNGMAVLCRDLAEAAEVADRLAPEHLQVMVAAGAEVAIHHAGALFLGPHAAEVLGDYGIGPNHVLPTGGTARHRGGLSVLDFLRVRTWLRLDTPKDSAEAVADAERLAELEGLIAHARAAGRRAVR